MSMPRGVFEGDSRGDKGLKEDFIGYRGGGGFKRDSKVSKLVHRRLCEITEGLSRREVSAWE